MRRRSGSAMERNARDAAASALVGLLASAGALGGTLRLAVAASMMAAITMALAGRLGPARWCCVIRIARRPCGLQLLQILLS